MRKQAQRGFLISAVFIIRRLKRFFGSREKDYRLTSNKNGVLEFVRYINDIPFYDDTVHIVLDTNGNVAKFDYNTDLP